jgi:hypothetical protein
VLLAWYLAISIGTVRVLRRRRLLAIGSPQGAET